MLRAGLGALEAVSAPGEGRVRAWFPKGCYLQLPSGIVALVPPHVHLGPIHMALDEPLPPIAAGVRVVVSNGELVVGSHGVRFAGAPAWRGQLPAPPRARRAVLRLREVLAEVAARSLVPEARARRALGLLRLADLRGAADVLAGVGPGLTPSGDDVLAGAFFAFRAAHGRGMEDRLVPLATAAPTTDLSRAFLIWAARGQAIAPVHALLTAADRRDARQAMAAARALEAVGESSGADVALGLVLAAEALSGTAPAEAERAVSRQPAR